MRIRSHHMVRNSHAPAAARLRRALVLAGLALSSCKSGGTEPYVRVRDPAPPALALPAGEAQLVALWGSWCPPCREETPALRALASDPPEGLRVAIVAVDEPDAEAKRTFPQAARVIADPQGELAKALRATELPAAFLVAGPDLVARFDGKRDWNGTNARRTLARLAAEARRRPVDAAPPEG